MTQENTRTAPLFTMPAQPRAADHSQIEPYTPAPAENFAEQDDATAAFDMLYEVEGKPSDDAVHSQPNVVLPAYEVNGSSYTLSRSAQCSPEGDTTTTLYLFNNTESGTATFGVQRAGNEHLFLTAADLGTADSQTGGKADRHSAVQEGMDLLMGYASAHATATEATATTEAAQAETAKADNKRMVGIAALILGAGLVGGIASSFYADAVAAERKDTHNERVAEAQWELDTVRAAGESTYSASITLEDARDDHFYDDFIKLGGALGGIVVGGIVGPAIEMVVDERRRRNRQNITNTTPPLQ